MNHLWKQGCYSYKGWSMRNYVILYNISDSESEKFFLEDLQRKFPRNKQHTENDFLYFCFAERDLPGVQDTLQESMDKLTLDEDDYIALYYTRKEEPDIINRLMIFGTAGNADDDLKTIPRTTHERTLAELLEYDFIFQKQ